MTLSYTLPYPPSVNTYWRHPSRGPLAGRHRIIAITPPDVVDEAAEIYDQHSRAWGKAKA